MRWFGFHFSFGKNTKIKKLVERMKENKIMYVKKNKAKKKRNGNLSKWKTKTKENGMINDKYIKTKIKGS